MYSLPLGYSRRSLEEILGSFKNGALPSGRPLYHETSPGIRIFCYRTRSSGAASTSESSGPTLPSLLDLLTQIGNGLAEIVDAFADFFDGVAGTLGQLGGEYS